VILLRANPDLRMLVFSPFGPVRDQLVGYTQDASLEANSALSVTVTDRVESRDLAVRYNITTDNVLVLAQGGRSRTVSIREERKNEDLALLDRRVDQALRELSLPDRRLVLLRQRTAGSASEGFRVLTDLAEAEGLIVIDTARTGTAIDPETDILIVTPSIAGASSPMPALREHLQRGGSGVLAMEPTGEGELGALGLALGLQFHRTELVDNEHALATQAKNLDSKKLVTNRVSPHPATRFAETRQGDLALPFDTVGYFSFTPRSTGIPLVRSMDTAFVDANGNGEQDVGERSSEYPLACAFDTSPGGRLLAFADATFLKDASMAAFSDSRLLVADGLRWLLARDSMGESPGPSTPAPLHSYPAVADHESSDAPGPPLPQTIRIERLEYRSAGYGLTLTRRKDGRLTARAVRGARVRTGIVPVATQRFLTTLLSNLRTQQQLGTLDFRKKKEFGLDGRQTLVLQSQHGVYTLLVGHRVHGSEERYALETMSGAAFVLPAALLPSLQRIPSPK